MERPQTREGIKIKGINMAGISTSDLGKDFNLKKEAKERVKKGLGNPVNDTRVEPVKGIHSGDLDKKFQLLPEAKERLSGKSAKQTRNKKEEISDEAETEIAEEFDEGAQDQDDATQSDDPENKQQEGNE